MKLSIIIPVYNEEGTIKELIKRVKDVGLSYRGGKLEKEIVVVDDGSSDGTVDILKGIQGIRVIEQETNQGKGMALKLGFSEATGEIVIVQDADLEYDPNDYNRLIKPILDDRADVVFGSRFKGEEQRVLYYWHYLGNTLITLFSNMLTNLNLTDIYTCYKVFKKEALDTFSHKLKSKTFTIEAELTAKVARGNFRVYEVPINYYGRTYEEGKKIRLKDGFLAIAAIFYFNILDR